MAELITGGFGTDVHNRIIQEIQKLTEARASSVLIVPEQHALSAEKEMSLVLPSYAPLYFEVSNFTRFANKCFRSLGGLASEHPDRSRRALLMWDCLTELSPALRIMGGHEINAGLVNRALSALKEAESYGATTDILDEAASLSRENNTRLADKLQDLSMLSALYRKSLKDKYNEIGSELELLIEKLEENPGFLRGENIYFEGFTSFTESQYKLIALLFERANVKIALTLSKSRQDGFEFSETRSARSRLLKIANKKNIVLKETRLDGNKEIKSPLLAEAANLLWMNGAKLDADILRDTSALTVIEAETPYREAQFVAADILKRVRDGYHFSDIAVIAGNLDSFLGILDDELKKAEIPFFLSKTRDILSFEAIKFIFSAIEVIDSGFAREDVITFLKSGFSGISRDACDEFELYAETWQLTGAQITSPAELIMNPDGYTSKLSVSAAEKLKRINKTKTQILELLIPLLKKFEKSTSVSDYANALVDFLIKADIEVKISERSTELLSLREQNSSEETAVLWQVICNALDTLVEASGESKSDLNSFKHRLELVLSESKIGRIPSYSDSVIVGSADSLRIESKKHIYLIGANLGKFPAIPTEGSYFGDKDKKELQKFGLVFENNSEFNYARELFYFSRAFSSANESLTISFSDTDTSFKASHPSEAVERIKKLSNGIIIPKKLKEFDKMEFLFDKNSALRLAGETNDTGLIDALKQLGFGDEIKKMKQKISSEDSPLSQNTIDLMYPGDIYLSQTRIDKFQDCPLAYFCEYKLKLSDCENAKFDARGIGSFIHSILENFFAKLRASEKKLDSISKEDRLKIAEEAARVYLHGIENETRERARTRFTISRLKNIAIPIIDELCDELSGSLFEPSFFELEVSDKSGSPGAVKFTLNDGSCIRVVGNIDRLDTYKTGNDVYVRVLDYKTGAKSFSPEDLKDGRNLQMFLYLKAIVDSKDKSFREKLGVTEDGTIHPAAVMYIKTNIRDIKIQHSDDAAAESAVKSNQKREGMLLNDEVSIGAMNPNFIPISYKKDGSPTAKSEKLLYSHSGWNSLSEDVEKAVVRVAESMKSGNVSALPIKSKNSSPCTYCKFKAICRNASIK